jgi:hypothetical protein
VSNAGRLSDTVIAANRSAKRGSSGACRLEFQAGFRVTLPLAGMTSKGAVNALRTGSADALTEW